MKTRNLLSSLRNLSKKRIYSPVAILAICVCLATAASGQNGGRAAPTGCGSDVTNLSLSVDLVSGALNPDFYSANNAYKTGKVRGDQITAMFQLGNCSQDFTLNLNFSSRYVAVNFPNGGGTYQAKFFNFDRVASVPVTTAANFLTSNFCQNGADPAPNGFVVTKNPDGSYRDNYAGCGTDGGGNFVRRTVGIALDDSSGNQNYRLRFQVSPLDGGFPTQVVNTAYIKVYHPTTTTWILEPELRDDPTTLEIEASAIGAKLFYDGNVFVNQGNYNMPFRFTLSKF